MKKILTIVGARPQIIKAAALSRVVRNQFSDVLQEKILHTGQHYDDSMSAVFFRELGIPQPDFQLSVGSGSHGQQTAKMLEGIEMVLLQEAIDALVVYGDTNSTVAGALAASKLRIPVVHIEAGLRSFNKSMPEEINRILTDHVSSLLFTPTQTGLGNLVKEGFNPGSKPPYSADNPGVFHCGDVMYDNSLFFASKAIHHESVFRDLGCTSGNFVLATIHRDNNTDQAERLKSIFTALLHIAEEKVTPIILPLHPRTKARIRQSKGDTLFDKVNASPNIHIIEPASFLQMIALEKGASIILTDSGGVQKEAYYFGKPCVILRPETEWVELITAGAAVLADADTKRIIEGFEHLIGKDLSEAPGFYGDGNAAVFIAETIIGLLK